MSMTNAMIEDYNKRKVILTFNIKRNKTSEYYKNNPLEQIEFYLYDKMGRSYPIPRIGERIALDGIYTEVKNITYHYNHITTSYIVIDTEEVSI